MPQRGLKPASFHVSPTRLMETAPDSLKPSSTTHTKHVRSSKNNHPAFGVGPTANNGLIHDPLTGGERSTRQSTTQSKARVQIISPLIKNGDEDRETLDVASFVDQVDEVERHQDPSGQFYYYNKRTGASSWKREDVIRLPASVSASEVLSRASPTSSMYKVKGGKARVSNPEPNGPNMQSLVAQKTATNGDQHDNEEGSTSDYSTWRSHETFKHKLRAQSLLTKHLVEVTEKQMTSSGIKVPDKALRCIPTNNRLRKVCIWLIQHPHWDKVVLVPIVLNLLCLLLYRPRDSAYYNDTEKYHSHDSWNQQLDQIDEKFNYIFTVEMMINLVALGGAYFSSNWNRLDSLVVVSGWVPHLMQAFNGRQTSNLSAFRAVRILKVLRTMKTSKGMRTLVNSLLHAMHMLVDVIYLLVFIFFIFGILAVQLYKGSLRQHCIQCADTTYEACASMVSGNATIEEDPTYCGLPSSFDKNFATCAQAGLHNHVCAVGYIKKAAGVAGVGSHHGTSAAWTWAYLTNPAQTPHQAHVPEQLNRNPNYGFTHFDSIGPAFLTIFQCITLEGWSDIMYTIIDTKGSSNVAYFILLILLGAFCVMNLAVAVIYDTYHEKIKEEHEAKQKQKKRASVGESSKSGSSWAGLSDAMRSGRAGAEPGSADGSQNTTNVKTSSKDETEGKRAAKEAKPISERSMVYQVVTAPLFDNTIMFCILANTVIMASESEDNTPSFEQSLERANLVFSCIFTAEMLLKGSVLGWCAYLHDRMNRFDAFVVLIFVFELVMAHLIHKEVSGFNLDNFNPTAFRALRLLRVFKLARGWKSLHQLIATIYMSLPGMVNFGVLLCIFMLTFALVGMQVYGGAYHGGNGFDEVPRNNFDTLYMSLLTVFQVLTGENWNEVMYDAMRIEYHFAPVFFVTMYVMGNYIMLNLFLAILLENFQSSSESGSESFYKVVNTEAHPLARIGATAWARIEYFVAKTCACTSPSSPEYSPDRKLELRDCGSTDSAAGVAAGNTTETLSPVLPRFDSCISEDGGETMVEIKPITLGEDLNLDQLRQLVRRLRHPVQGVKLKMHTRGRRHYPDSFMASDACDWLMRNRFAGSADAAERIGRNLMTEGLVFRVDGSSNGEDPKFTNNEFLYGCQLRPRHNLLLEGGADFEKELNKKKRLKDKDRKRAEREHVLTGVSLGLMGPKNPLRVCIAHLITHWAFETFIIFLIFVSSVLLAMQTPGREFHVDSADLTSQVMFWLDKLLTLLFLCEALMKIIAMGFIFIPKAYLKDPWNILDFGIVCVSVIDMVVEFITASSGSATGADASGVSRGPAGNMAFLKSMRVARALRPLRVISRAPGMRMVVNSIFNAAGAIINVLTIIILVFTMFAILGIQLFRGRFKYCDGCEFNDRYIYSQEQCHGACPLGDGGEPKVRVWRNPPFHFDSWYMAMITLFEISTLEMWPDMMFHAMDVTRKGAALERNNAPEYAMFFVAFIFVGAFFIMNLFVGVIIDKFGDIKNEMNGSAFLSDAQKQWRDAQRMMIYTPRPKRIYRPKFLRHARTPVYNLVQSKRFEKMIMLVIILNICTMAMEEFRQSEVRSAIEQWCNLGFVGIFAAEMLLKLFGLGIFRYFKERWNIFDFVVLGCSIVEIQLQNIGLNLTILRVARIFRIFRLVKLNKSLKALLETLMFSLPSLGNIGSLLLLTFFVYAVLGMNLFGQHAYDGDFLNRHANFRDVGMGMLTLFRCSTGESWNGLMHETADVANLPMTTNFYFISFSVLCFFMMVNLFIAVILENFADANQHNEQIKPEHMEEFSSAWSQVVEEIEGENYYMLPSFEVVTLLNRLAPPLGMKGQSHTSDMQHFMINHIRSLRLKRNKLGQIFFLDTLHAICSAVMPDEGQQPLAKNVEAVQELDEKIAMKANYRFKVITELDEKAMFDVDLTEEINVATMIQARWRCIASQKRYRKNLASTNMLDAAGKLKKSSVDIISNDPVTKFVVKLKRQHTKTKALKPKVDFDESPKQARNNPGAQTSAPNLTMSQPKAAVL